jgi:hypothetical protein
MNRLILSVGGVAAALVVAVVAIGYFYGPLGPGGATEPVYTSERHHYAITLPDDTWSVGERPGTWAPGAYFDTVAPGIDYLEQAGTDGEPVEQNVYLASQPIPAGTSFEAWADGVVRANMAEYPCLRQHEEFEPRTVGGESGRSATFYCADPGDIGPVLAVRVTLVEHSGQGYAIYILPPADPSETPVATVVNDLRAEADFWLPRISFPD